MNKVFCLLLFIYYPIIAFCQDNVFNNLSRVLDSADSVILISHVETGDVVLMKDNKQINMPLLNNNKVNYAIVKKGKTLNRNEIDNLKLILVSLNNDSLLRWSPCFMPRHAILIKKQDKFSFIEICFTCNSVYSSDDLNFDHRYFSQQKWKDLESFFFKKGLLKK